MLSVFMLVSSVILSVVMLIVAVPLDGMSFEPKLQRPFFLLRYPIIRITSRLKVKL
jgi:hypothetical protein